MNTTSLDQNLVQGSDDDGEDETEDETRDDNCSFIVSLGYNTNILHRYSSTKHEAKYRVCLYYCHRLVTL